MAQVKMPAVIRQGLLAGVAGGLAEVASVSLYAAVNGGDAALLARGVTTAAGVDALLPAAPATVGVAVHMALAVALGIAAMAAWRTWSRAFAVSNPFPFFMAALAGVWAFNFFVVLPVVSPAFIGLVPYGVSLASKLLFGAAAAEVVRRQTRAQAVENLAPVRIRYRR